MDSEDVLIVREFLSGIIHKLARKYFGYKPEIDFCPWASDGTGIEPKFLTGGWRLHAPITVYKTGQHEVSVVLIVYFGNEDVGCFIAGYDFHQVIRTTIASPHCKEDLENFLHAAFKKIKKTPKLRFREFIAQDIHNKQDWSEYL
jgi:hypothetical protein